MGRKPLKQSEKGERANVHFPPGRLDDIKKAAKKRKMNFSKYINWLFENFKTKWVI